MKRWIKRVFPVGSTGRWILAGLYLNPIRFIFVLIKSIYATYRLTKRVFPIRVRLGLGQDIIVEVSQNTSVLLSGNIYIDNFLGNSEKSSIILSNGSTLKIHGDLAIGPGVHIYTNSGAVLEFGGKRSTASGITCNSRIMVEEYVQIGADTIIAWSVFISDSDWHDISWGKRVDRVVIGDNVWIAHDVSVMKGVTIPNGCVVGAKSLVTKSLFSEKSILAGVPATVRKKNVEWNIKV